MMDLFDHVPPETAFGGITYEPARDYKRLKTLLERVRAFMSDYRWHSLTEIANACGGSEASVSARLRDLRKPKFGTHMVERKNLHDGFWVYRLRLENEKGSLV